MNTDVIARKVMKEIPEVLELDEQYEVIINLLGYFSKNQKYSYKIAYSRDFDEFLRRGLIFNNEGMYELTKKGNEYVKSIKVMHKIFLEELKKEGKK